MGDLGEAIDKAYKEAFRQVRKKTGKIVRILILAGDDVGLTLIEEIDIPIGSNEEELWEIFKAIIKAVQKEDKVIMDITHSLRNIPLQAITALEYAKVMSSIEIKGVYYGAFEVGELRENGIKETPIFDLSSYIQLMEWTQLIYVFLQTGNARGIVKFYDQYKHEKINIDKTITKLAPTIGALGEFTDSIANSRGRTELNDKKQMGKSIQKAAQKVEQAIKALNKEQEGLIVPLQPLFNKVLEKVTPFLNKNTYEIGIETVRWCIEYSMIQQGYTALEETIITYVGYQLSEENRAEVDINNKYHRLSVSNILNAAAKEDVPLLPKTIENFENAEELVEWCKAKESLCKLVQGVKEKRNDINHFGFTDKVIGNKKLEDSLVENFKLFQEIVGIK